MGLHHKACFGLMLASALAAPPASATVTIDIATGATHEYGYLLSTGSGVSDIVAINDHQFLRMSETARASVTAASQSKAIVQNRSNRCGGYHQP